MCDESMLEFSSIIESCLASKCGPACKRISVSLSTIPRSCIIHRFCAGNRILMWGGRGAETRRKASKDKRYLHFLCLCCHDSRGGAVESKTSHLMWTAARAQALKWKKEPSWLWSFDTGMAWDSIPWCVQRAWWIKVHGDGLTTNTRSRSSDGASALDWIHRTAPKQNTSRYNKLHESDWKLHNNPTHAKTEHEIVSSLQFS